MESIMGWLIEVSITLLVVIVVMANAASKYDKFIAWCGCFVTICLYIFGLVLASGYDTGTVTPMAESFSEQLKAGVVYQFVWSNEDNGSYVLLVKPLGSSNFRAIRTKEMPPSTFTLINGKPVAVEIPPEPPSAK